MTMVVKNVCWPSQGMFLWRSWTSLGRNKAAVALYCLVLVQGWVELCLTLGKLLKHKSKTTNTLECNVKDEATIKSCKGFKVAVKNFCWESPEKITRHFSWKQTHFCWNLSNFEHFQKDVFLERLINIHLKTIKNNLALYWGSALKRIYFVTHLSSHSLFVSPISRKEH